MSAPSEFLSGLAIRQFLTIAGYVVLVYDYLLTVDLEIDYIWRAPWSAVKALFLLDRYGTLIGQSFLLLEELGTLSDGSRKFCRSVQWFQALFVLCSSETTRSLLLLRAWALWRCSYRVAISMVSIYVFYVLLIGGYASYIIFKYDGYFEYPYLDETAVCVVYAEVSNTWLLGVISLLLDTGIFTVITYYLYKLCRGSRYLWRSPLLRLLVRDAVLFYMANLFHDIFTVLTLSVFVHDPRNLTQVAFSFPLLTVTGQRAVLNLRGFRSRSYTTQEIERSIDRQIAAIRQRSFWQSADLWMNDLHEELKLNESARYRTTRSIESRDTEEGDSYELGIIHISVGSST